MLRFDNPRDSHSRLVDTLVMYDNRAMHVRNITENNRLQGEMVLSGEAVTVDQEDPLYSSVCPSLGYLNTREQALYFMRQPVRRWKQGIDARALVCPSRGIRARGLIDNRAIAECLERRYPSLEASLRMFTGINPFDPARRLSVAFSPHFAVSRGVDGHLLEYKGREVGVVENNVPVLGGRFFWLRELLEAEL